MRSIAFLPSAQEDLADAAEYLERRRAGLGTEFEMEIAGTLERVRANPFSAPEVLPGVHRVTTPRFHYSIFYKATPARVLVYAVMHQRRDPRGWRDRL